MGVKAQNPAVAHWKETIPREQARIVPIVLRTLESGFVRFVRLVRKLLQTETSTTVIFLSNAP
jgi:hypothetical protein